MAGRPKRALRRGWTTGACAAAAARAAFAALVTGEFPDPVTVRLPGGSTSFPLALKERHGATARAGIVKDAGDDPDVTHGALVIAEVRRGAAGAGLRFFAGPGVGTVTLPGLPLGVGEPAINPGPRAMIRAALAEIDPATDADVTLSIPGGETLALTRKDEDSATAGIVKDAGDDPDVTHGALILATVRAGAPGSGVTFRAGEGVGTVTRAGLPVPPGEPAINPVPRRMIRDAVAEVAAMAGCAIDAAVELSIPGGEVLAARTLNGRLGIVGGLSILGTTGIVVPYSCSAWIYSIRSGIDVARAAGLTHIAGATGTSSEAAAQKLYGLPEIALIDMGDFVGGMLKYLDRKSVV
jgi:cobalamin biosynthesis protein CbiD